MDVGAAFAQALDLEFCALVGMLQTPIIEPLSYDGAVVDCGAALGRRRENELGVGEGGSEGFFLCDVMGEEGRAEGGCVGAAAVKDYECLFVGR